jgi:hypothetical protein
MLIVGLGVFGLSGWIAAIYVAYNSKFVVSPVELLLAAISKEIDVPFVEAWLRATLLNQRAIDAYWHRNDSLRVEKISISSEITARDVRNTITITGTNESRADVDCCPMLLIGGSTLHFEDFGSSSSYMRTSDQRLAVRTRSVTDLGLLQLIEIVFPTLLCKRQKFDIEHTHEWPGGMTPGIDIMWYPYAALFRRDTDRLSITAKFETEVVFIRGYVANLSTGTCNLARVQPMPIGSSSLEYAWNLDSIDNEEIYVLVFER